MGTRTYLLLLAIHAIGHDLPDRIGVGYRRSRSRGMRRCYSSCSRRWITRSDGGNNLSLPKTSQERGVELMPLLIAASRGRGLLLLIELTLLLLMLLIRVAGNVDMQLRAWCVLVLLLDQEARVGLRVICRVSVAANVSR